MPVELNAPATRKSDSSANAPAGASGKPGFTLKGHHIFMMLVAFFGVIGSVNAYMITMALKTLPGVEAKSAYEQSQKFNKGLEALAEQNRKGWQVDVVTGGLKHGTPLTVQVRDNTGAAILGMKVIAKLQRPTNASLDHTLDLREIGSGVYSASLPDLQLGQWRLAVEVKRGEQREFFSEGRVVAKE